MKKALILILTLTALAACFAGCGGSDDTVQNFVVSGTAYTDTEAFKNAEQPKTLPAGSAVYASIDFIESPQGMKYKVRWSLDGKEIKLEEKTIEKGPRNIVCCELEAERVTAGTLRAEVMYKETALCERELTVG